MADRPVDSSYCYLQATFSRTGFYRLSADSRLMKLMVDPATPASGRIRAALGTFALAREALDLDIETRVAALEQAAELSKQGR